MKPLSKFAHVIFYAVMLTFLAVVCVLSACSGGGSGSSYMPSTMIDPSQPFADDNLPTLAPSDDTPTPSPLPSPTPQCTAIPAPSPAASGEYYLDCRYFDGD